MSDVEIGFFFATIQMPSQEEFNRGASQPKSLLPKLSTQHDEASMIHSSTSKVPHLDLFLLKVFNRETPK
ncbi:MAG: hypothetical protein LBQ79_01695 [Deltaproteobacteria bacterium]|nr:hypothetical protein [Deltaproteobacteria bacterium]